MTRRTFAAALSAIPSFGQRRRAEKGPEVELLEVTARIESDRLTLDGRVRNVSDRPLKGLVIFFEMLDADQKVLTRQKGTVEEGALDPGAEATFESQMAWHARAVRYRTSFEDGGGRELRASGTGPFPFE